MKLNNLEDVLTEELKDLYSAENQILKALPKLAKAAEGELRMAFEQHLEQTHMHVERIEQACKELEISPKGKKCAGMEGLLAEGAEVLETEGSQDALEAAMIGAAQRVEHYEIAGYGTAKTHAEQLGFSKVAKPITHSILQTVRHRHSFVPNPNCEKLQLQPSHRT